MRRIKLDSSVFLLAAIVLLLAAGGLFAYFSLRTDPIADALSGDRVINTLFVIEDQGKPLSSLVLLYYPATKRAALFDVPGEIGLIIQSINRVDRIDTLYNGKKSPLYVKAVQDLLGITIPFQVILPLNRLCQLVDLLDGVDLFIPDPVEVYEGPTPILLPPGLVRLDGDKCRLYATYTVPDEEPGASAARRERLFLALLKRLGERKDFLKQTGVSSFFHSLLATNMNHRTTDKLFNELSAVDVERVPVQTVGGNKKEVSGHPLIFPFYDGSLIKEIVSQSLSALTRKTDGALSDRVYTVQVLNGTVSSGMARRTADLLRGFGYDVISVGNADSTDYAKTQIIDRSGSPEMAQVFADVIHCPTIVTEARGAPAADAQNLEYKADFTIIIGKDFNGRYVVR